MESHPLQGGKVMRVSAQSDECRVLLPLILAMQVQILSWLQSCDKKEASGPFTLCNVIVLWRIGA